MATRASGTRGVLTDDDLRAAIPRSAKKPDQWTSIGDMLDALCAALGLEKRWDDYRKARLSGAKGKAAGDAALAVPAEPEPPYTIDRDNDGWGDPTNPIRVRIFLDDGTVVGGQGADTMEAFHAMCKRLGTLGDLPAKAATVLAAIAEME